MKYTLNQLAIFLKIVEEKSITKASEILNLTQPAVSIQLKNFQNQFDIPLTEVIGRKLYITDFGKEIAIVAENIINQVKEIDNKTLSYKGQLTGKLKISVVSTGKYVIPYFVSKFVKQHPNIELQIDVTNKNKVIKSLENNEVDFALVSIIPENLNINKIDLLNNKLYLIGPNSKDQKEKIQHLIENIPIIFREEGSGTRQTMEKYIERNQLRVQKKMKLTTNEAVKQAVLSGLGYSIMPLIGIKNELIQKELQIIPTKGLPITTKWSLISLKGKKHTPVSVAFLKHLQLEKENIVKEHFNWYENH